MVFITWHYHYPYISWHLDALNYLKTIHNSSCISQIIQKQSTTQKSQTKQKGENVVIPATCYIHLSSFSCQTTAAFHLQTRENERERHSKQELFKSISIISNKLSCSWFERWSSCKKKKKRQQEARKEK